MSTLVFWIVTLCGLVGWFQRFGGTYCLYLQDWSEGVSNWIVYMGLGEGPGEADLHTRVKGWGEDREMVWANRKQPHRGNQKGRLCQERERGKGILGAGLRLSWPTVSSSSTLQVGYSGPFRPHETSRLETDSYGIDLFSVWEGQWKKWVCRHLSAVEDNYTSIFNSSICTSPWKYTNRIRVL
jgi:hypothetical protein